MVCRLQALQYSLYPFLGPFLVLVGQNFLSLFRFVENISQKIIIKIVNDLSNDNFLVYIWSKLSMFDFSISESE